MNVMSDTPISTGTPPRLSVFFQPVPQPSGQYALQTPDGSAWIAITLNSDGTTTRSLKPVGTLDITTLCVLRNLSDPVFGDPSTGRCELFVGSGCGAQR